jgi:hypothetical protein
MADSAFKTQVSRTEAANSASNVIFTQLADNAGNAVSVTGNKLDVNASVTLETAYVDDSAFVIGTDKVNAQGFLADETATDSVDEGDIGLARMTLDRRMITSAEQSGTWNIGTVTTLTGITNDVSIDDGGNSITVDNSTLSVVGGGTEATALRVTIASDSTGLLSIDDGGGSITVDGSVTVTATDLDIRDLVHTQDSIAIGDGTDLLGINADGSINVVVAGSSGTKIHDYATATPGAGASANNDYTIAGSSFELSRVEWSGSGKMKVEILVGPVGTLVTKAVGFSEKDNKEYIEFDPVLVVPATGTGTVRVIMTNRQGAAVDVYSTIMGNDIA